MLYNKLRSSLGLSFLDKYVGYTLRFVATVLVARLCTPEDIGIFSVAFVLISIGHVLRDFGVAQYLIQEKDIDNTKIRASLTLMWLIAWSLCALLWVSKGAIANFYGEPELVHAIEVLSLIYLLAPFGSVRIALLRRDMDFASLAKINIASYVCLHTVTIGMAWMGFGYYALVWGQVAGVIATLLGTLVYGPRVWFFPGLSGIKQVLSFGLPLCTANIIETTSDGAADLILGKTMSMHAVGMFGRAQGLMSLFKIAVTSAVWPVVLPFFSEKNRRDEDLIPDYRQAMQYYTVFAWPFFLGLGFFASTIIYVLFGPQWDEAAPLVRVLCLVAFLQSIFPFCNALMVAKGQVHVNLRMQSSLCLLRIVAVAIGAYWHMFAVACALVVAELIGVVIFYRGINKVFVLTLPMIMSTLKKSLVCGLSVGLFLLVWDKLARMSQMSPILSFVIAVPLSMLIWGLTLRWSHHPLAHLIESMIKKRSLKHAVS